MSEAKVSIELPMSVARHLTHTARAEFRDEAMHIAYMLHKLYGGTQPVTITAAAVPKEAVVTGTVPTMAVPAEELSPEASALVSGKLFVRKGSKQFRTLQAAVELSTNGSGECFLTPKLASHHRKMWRAPMTRGHMSSHINHLVEKGAITAHRVEGGQNTYEASLSGVAFIFKHMENDNEL